MTKLSKNEVFARSRASCLNNVRKLICWGSNLTDIGIIQQMVNLEVLSISVNNLTSLKDLSFCPKLKEVYMRKNYVKDIEQITYLKNLPQLTSLWLADNPVSSLPNYRDTVIRNLPHLQKFDSTEVTDAERKLAEKHGILLESKEILPSYEGLDLNHTLTEDAVSLHTEKIENLPLSVDEKLSKIENLPLNVDEKLSKIENLPPSVDEILPEIAKTDYDNANEGRKNLSVANSYCNGNGLSNSVCNGNMLSKSSVLTSIDASVEGESDVSSFTNKNTNVNSNSRRSNTVNAVLLLLNDLSHSELQQVQACTLSLLENSSRADNLLCSNEGFLED